MEDKFKQKIEYEKAKLAEAKRKKLEGSLIPKDDVISVLKDLKRMHSVGIEIDFDRLIKNVEDF